MKLYEEYTYIYILGLNANTTNEAVFADPSSHGIRVFA